MFHMASQMSHGVYHPNTHSRGQLSSTPLLGLSLLPCFAFPVAHSCPPGSPFNKGLPHTLFVSSSAFWETQTKTASTWQAHG